ncbi:peptidoglycan-binding protein [Neptunomonas japonica]|uniref:peptidoglycan-binding protein n=1 Tax=Neptunomonas japonica TaxID=417574 RepID=UPI00041EB688|nr:peptidoglycan-binding protein [Neptunomonas japonica]
MTTFRIAALASIYLALTSTNITAAALDNNQFSIKGVGNFVCSRFVNDMKETGSTSAFMYGGWAYGYLTGENRYSKETFDLAPWENLETLTNYLHTYCTKNPSHTYGVAVLTMVDALRADRLTKPSPPIDLETEHGKVRVYLATVIRAQKKLYDEDYFKGKPDGAYGPQTRAAIEKYQSSKNLKVNGLLDQATLYSLFRTKN